MGLFDFKNILIEQKGNIWILKIHRPEALNALNSLVLSELAEFFRMIGEMDFEHARGLLITGSGEKAFVAGADIKEMSGMTIHQAKDFSIRGQSIFHELALLKIPVLAAVNGFALGGGCELALACDFIYASENAKFGLPEVTLGLIPGFGGTVSLSRAIGLRKAKEWTFSGELMSAQEALQVGLVNRVYTQQELIEKSLQKLEQIAVRAPLAVSSAKSSILQGWDLEIEEAHSRESQLFGNLFDREDTKEGMKAFMEKRKAQFLGK